MANRKYANAVQARKARDRANNRCKRKTTKMFTIRLHKVYDASVVKQLNDVDNRTDYIRQLILADLNKNKEGN